MIAPVSEGQILAGKYRVERVLGVGGMGVVVAAHHVQLEDRVAIKFLLPAALDNPETVARFAREARAAVKIKSEHVARVIDVGTLESGAPYMVMEYLDGTDLARWLAVEGALPVQTAVDFVLQASEAIAEAHALGIVHRDLKPANLFVVRRPDGGLTVKVLDFGISKSVGIGGPGSDLTHSSAIMGSPLYMSPEQLKSAKTADARCDIWALGVIFFELVTGKLPFEAESLPELVHRIAAEDPLPLRQLLPSAPPALERVVLKSLERDRERRYQSVAELCVDLLPFGPRRSRLSVERISGVLRAAGLSATSVAIPPSSESAPGVTTGGAWGRTNLRLRESGKRLLVGAVALGAVGLVALLSRRSAAPAPPNHLVSVSAASDTPGERASERQPRPEEVKPPASGPEVAPVPSAAAPRMVVTPATETPVQLNALPVEPPEPPMVKPAGTPKPRMVASATTSKPATPAPSSHPTGTSPSASLPAQSTAPNWGGRL